MSSRYNLISADSHVVEPADLFDTLPADLRDRAPRVISHDGGSAWFVEGFEPVHLPTSAMTGSGYRTTSEDDSRPVTFANILPALRDPVERLKAQVSDSVDAEILYPTTGLWDLVKQIEDAELQLACARRYNDWIAGFCAAEPDRLIGLGKIPGTSVEDACAELRRCVTQLGLRGVVLDTWPCGSAAGGDPLDEPFWELVNELRVPVSIHFAISPTANTLPPQGIFPGMKPPAAELMMPMVSAGVFDRFPNVRLVFAHGDASWAIHWLEFTDMYYLRRSHLTQGDIDTTKPLPSEYVRKHCFFTFHHDRPAVRNRRNLGPAHLMWASHFPYDDTNWPDNRQQAVRTTIEAGEAQADLMAGNVARLYRLPGYESSFSDEQVTAFDALVHY